MVLICIPLSKERQRRNALTMEMVRFLNHCCCIFAIVVCLLNTVNLDCPRCRRRPIILASHNGSCSICFQKECFDNGNGKISESLLLLHYCHHCIFVFVIVALFVVVVNRCLLFASHNCSSLYYLYSTARWTSDDHKRNIP